MATVAGLYEVYENAERGLKELHKHGFDHGDISIIAPQSAIDKGLNVSEEEETSPGQTAAAGAVVGGLGGLILGASALLIPGIGLVITAGTLAAALGATAIGAGVGAAAGGLLAALIDLGIDERDAKAYEAGIRNGGILITVIAEGEKVAEVKNIFRETKAIDIDTRRSVWERGSVNDYEEATSSSREERSSGKE